MIDNYRIYCLSENCTNNLMWGHYSNSHYGFCIEFNSKYIKTNRLIYQNDIATLDVFEVIKSSYLKNKNNSLLIKKIHEAFCTKLRDWSYEKEYRLIASKELLKNELRRTDKISIFKYEEDWINSIVFGCRMPIDVRNYIIENIPYKVNFKEVIELKSTLKVIDYKLIS